MPIRKYMYVDEETTVHVSYDEDKETVHLFGIQNTAPLLLQNAQDRKDPSNGFTQSRQGAFGRKVASVDPVVYRVWQREFENMGGKKQDDWVPDWRAFLKKKLNDNPQYYTVEKMVTHNINDGHVVIR